MEKMLMTQALDERDFLVKKIQDKIRLLHAVDLKRCNEKRTVDKHITVDEYRQQAESAYQQITDLIDRYMRLDAAIIASNAPTAIEIGGKQYSVASAIALKRRLKGMGICGEDGVFEKCLANRLKDQYKTALEKQHEENKEIERKAENMLLAILGKDAKPKDDTPLDVVDAFVQSNRYDIVDPLDAGAKATGLFDRIDALLSALETGIKIANATVTVEF